MEALEFLRVVWPETGLFALDVSKDRYHRAVVCKSIEEAAEKALDFANDHEVYFATHTLINERVWSAPKNKWVFRTKDNMLESRVFFFDLDVGEGKGFPTQADAVKSLNNFCKDVGLPRPMLVSSGYGVHVYWPIQQAIPSEEWRGYAHTLKRLAAAKGLHVDPSRVEDTTSVLRVAGTINHKRGHRAPVRLWGSLPAPYANAEIIAAITVAGETLPPDLLGSSSYDGLGDNTHRIFEGRQVTMAQLGAACAQVRAVAKVRGKVSRQPWFHFLNTVRFVENGRHWAHELSKGDPQYTYAETEQYLAEAESNESLGPTSCAVWYRDSDTPSLCDNCDFRGVVKGPAVAAGKPQHAEVNAFPIGPETAGEPELLDEDHIEIARNKEMEELELPLGYIRVEGGGVKYRKVTDDDIKDIHILGCDLYPMFRKVDREAETDQHMWCYHNPRESLSSFSLDSGLLHDPQKLMQTISRHGVYVTPGPNIKLVQQYMSLYIQKLQRAANAEDQVGQLGWRNEYTKFVLSDKILNVDGTTSPAFLRPGVSTEMTKTLMLGKRGSLAKQVEAMKFYEGPENVMRQFFVLSSLASVIFYMTGHHGSVVHANGEPGTSKSTSLGYAMSMWGHPEKAFMNGLKDGGTVNSRNFLMSSLNSLPFGMDEISDIAADVANQFVLGVTQASPQKRRMERTADALRPANIGERSNLVITTGNVSLHALLAGTSVMGDAGTVRVFELSFDKIDDSREAQARAMQFFDTLKENYGHIGEEFLKLVMQQQAALKERMRQMQLVLIGECGLSAGERFYAAVAAAILVAAEVTYKAGLLTYHPRPIYDWLVTTQIPAMRGPEVERAPTSVRLLSNYLSEINDNLVVMSEGNTMTVREPRGKIKGRFEPESGQLWLARDAFRDYCVNKRVPALQCIHELEKHKIVVNRTDRKVLTAGTPLPGARTWCFVVDMRHEDMAGMVTTDQKSGRPTLTLIEGGKDGSVR